MGAVSLNTFIEALPPAGSSGPLARLWRILGYGGRRCYSCRTSFVTHVIPVTGKHACAKCAEELARAHPSPSHHGTDTSTLVGSGGGAATLAEREQLRLQAQLTRREAEAARRESRRLRTEVTASLTEMQIKVTAAVEWATTRQRPARRLWAVNTTAGEHAVGNSQRAKDLARTTFATSGDAQTRGDDEASREARSYQGVAAVIHLQDTLQETAIVEERDRIAAHLPEEVIRRVFTAGLALQSAAGLAGKPEVLGRIEAAIDQLDHVIRVIRDTIYNGQTSLAGHGR